MRVTAHHFRPADCVGGHAVLDFINTVTARDEAVPIDWLDGYPRLLEWASIAGVLTSGDRARLASLASARRAQASAALLAARRLRESLHRVFGALVEGLRVPPPDAARLEKAWKQAVARSTLGRGVPFEPTPSVQTSRLDFVVDTLALQAVELLQDLPAGRLRVCAGTRCGWLFLDTSKGGRRVWCDMATCGNVAKSRRFHARARAASAP